MMLTRGYYIGQIIDELSSLNQTVNSRGKQHLFDINIHCENFVRDLLNLIHGWNLHNLNRDRLNTEGLDLAEDVRKIGIQVTSNAGAPKVHKTLKNTDSNNYPTVYIVVVGTKQGHFTLDESVTKPFNFTLQNIWDLDDLVRQIIDKKIVELKEILEFLQENCQRVRIELEQVNEDGRYPTDLDDYIEPIPKAILRGYNSYIAFQKKIANEWEIEPNEIEANLKDLINKLISLPRITRQFYSMMVERATEGAYGRLFIHDGYLNRICTWPSIQGEIELLVRSDLITDVEQFEGGMQWQLLEKSTRNQDPMLSELKNFALQTVGMKKIFVELDFSSLA